ncbi:SurA N-terminal domain protein [Bacteriovorax sp. BSW11_IV]|uniref:SurA N-terminal domain-containing protein n=1 Tax=Bacteriovorax sp. BSW11_IV TaxID=1353529 RepID=UPI000389E3A9|nr:SurA N-terminal domain-containing protein [Bacteriovorax sp. BSW11_IV]EQC47945.1 SurA N-terminal domain protein [Bacteriovorax sp. BSW11_IV]
MKRFFLFISLLICFNANAVLLDKIVAVIDDNVITQSMVSRIKTNIEARRNISPFIYKKSKYTDKEVAEILVHVEVVRNKLTELGVVISDDHVESEIKGKEKALGLSRQELLKFLKNNKTTFDEFFEITREAIEFNQFNSRVIAPLISVTDQEVKNKFFNDNLDNKTLSFKYTLVDFSLDKNIIGKNKTNFRDALKTFQTSGVIPEKYKNMKTNVLGDITEEGLTAELKKILKQTEEGKLSAPITLYDEVHVFFVKKKDLVESEQFTRVKENIRGQLFTEKALDVTESWYKREVNKHYVKYFF